MRILALLALMAGMSWGQELVGTWRLVKGYETRPNGDMAPLYGANPAGILMYDGQGNVAVQIYLDGKNADGETHIAYFGTYKIDKEAGTVAHVVKASTRASYRGTTQLRFVMLEGKRLTLGVTPLMVNGEMRLRTLVWEKMP